MKPVLTVWTDHLKDEKRKAEFEITLRNSTAVIRRLRELLQLDLADLDKKDAVSYSSPAWAYEQADRIGRRAQIRKLLTLTSFIEG